jgi:hypothetical protein
MNGRQKFVVRQPGYVLVVDFGSVAVACMRLESSTAGHASEHVPLQSKAGTDRAHGPLVAARSPARGRCGITGMPLVMICATKVDRFGYEGSGNTTDLAVQ